MNESSFLPQEDLTVIENSRLFSGIHEKDLVSLLSCLSAWKKSYRKDDTILRIGSRTTHVGLLLSGRAHIERYDYWGNRSIVAAILPGDLFGESYAASPDIPLGVNVRADEDSTVLILNLGKILPMCSSACPFHALLIENLVSLLASRNLRLSEKLTYITQHTLRDKLLTYLSAESRRQNSAYFDIPFNRQQLADYLNADRSALSGELSRLKKEGILDFQKNHFRLIIPPESVDVL